MKYIANLFFAPASQSWCCSGGDWPPFTKYPSDPQPLTEIFRNTVFDGLPNSVAKLYPMERVKECMEMCKERSAEPKSSSEFAKSFKKISCGQGGRSWQPFSEGENGHKIFRRDKDVVFAHTCKFTNSIQHNAICTM